MSKSVREVGNGRWNMAALDMTTEQTPRGTVVRLIGDASVEHVGELEEHLKKLETMHSHKLVMDMSRVDYIGSIGLGMLIRFRSQVESAGGRLRIAAVDPSIMEAFKSSRLDQVFDIHQTVDGALT